MDIAVSPDEILKVLARDFPLQYQIAALTVVVTEQNRRIAELERAPLAQAPVTAEE